MKHKDFVELISKRIGESRSARIWQDSVNMLSTVSENVFSRSAHFILELLQNAEDAGIGLAAGHGEIEFRISPDRVKVIHNGAPFKEENVDAICGVRSCKKPEQGTLGYLGIGFKSVFKVSDCPEVHSGGFHFKFDKGAFVKPAEEMWQITPVWLDVVEESCDPRLTTFILPFRSADAYAQTLQELRKLDVHIFLFLRWLKELVVVDEAKGETTRIRNEGEASGVVSLSRETKNAEGMTESKRHRFMVFRRNADVPVGVAKDETLEFYKRQMVKQREVVLAFGVDDADNLQPIEDASALGSVASFLPLIEERSGAKFLIQSDFLVQPGREAIQYELSWNHWLVGEAAELAKVAVEKFKKHAKWREQFLPVFKFKSYWGQASFEKLFLPKLQTPLSEYMKGGETFATESGRCVSPELVVHPDEEVRGLISDKDLVFLFPGTSELRLSAAGVDFKSIPDDVQARVIRVGLGKVARCKPLLEERVKESVHVRWFVKLYGLMAESGQDFRQELYRTSKARGWYDSPIYVLTDKKAIVSAKEAYLREIPQEVLQLRKRFPEVDALLASYQQIDRELGQGKLAEFFRERTHVQPIDYGKICREVLLPKVTVNVPAPVKDDLIAYTRLLEKGPRIDGPIWVVAKSGKFEQSNHVFFGADYAPSENWEKLGKHAPHIEFLSSDYLQGVPGKDRPGWKEFFSGLGVKESGEKHDVETFAVEFVKANLAGELSHFVAKDRLKHGYDLEATQTGIGKCVRLEVKGRRGELPIDLEGKEPEAARQSKMNGELFWLCVVPGIPENPELWVVDDVTTIGQTNVLSVPVSAWKQYGRRVV